jgi:hypothetical protein
MSATIPFTQYMRPDGRPVSVSVNRPSDIAEKAAAIIARGLVFECEELADGTVSLTITDPDEGDVDIELVPNGPGVPAAVDRLVLRQSAPPATGA